MKIFLMLYRPLRTILAVFLIGSLLAPGLELNLAIGSENPEPLEGYASFPEVESRLLALSESPYADLRSLGQTLGERDIWLLTVSKDPETVKPAIVVMGNVAGSHLLGRELALGMAESIVQNAESDQSMAELLSKFTIYFIPSPTPDASEKNFELPMRQHDGNLTPTDDDRDFSVGEDPPQDLNEDGWITMMRIAEPFGTHRTHPSDSRVLIPVDRKKGEVGEYRLLVESLDSDSDESFGEDGSDGVDFNRNFTFNYQFFGRSAGPHQVSETETRAVADFLFDHPNIAAVFCFSPEDNLFHTWKGSPQTDAARIKTKVLTEDQLFLDRLAGQYRKLHGGKSAPQSPSGAGSFSEWSYFHYGRWTFAARGWWVPPAKQERGKPEAESSDSNDVEKDESSSEEVSKEESKEESAKPVDDANDTNGASTVEDASEKETDQEATGDGIQESAADQKNPALGKDDRRGADELNALAWYQSQDISAFVEWQPFEHPDFPDKQVEIGGFKPHVLLNPPSHKIAPLVKPHVEFLKEIAKKLPKIEIRDVKIQALGPGLFDVSCKIVNVGPLPTMPLMGSTNRQWYPIQVQLAGVDPVRWIEGSQRQSVGRLSELGGAKELRWVFLAEELPEDFQGFTITAQAPTLHPVDAKVEIPANSSE